MKIFVKVKTRARTDELEKTSKNTFLVKVREVPEKGRANKAIIKLLSEYFKIPQQKVKIVSGVTSKIKIIEISG